MVLFLFFRLGTFYNAIFSDDDKPRVEKWASKTYPSAWNELVSVVGYRTGEDGTKIYKVERELHA